MSVDQGFILISNARVNNCNKTNTIETWLADLRKRIVNQFAGQHITSYEIFENEHPHVYTVLYQYCYKQKWNIPGYERLPSLNEIYSKFSYIGKDHLKLFHNYFLDNYTPHAIITEIAERLNTGISEHLRKMSNGAKQVIVTSEKALFDLLKNFPIVGHGEWITTIFDFIDEEKQQDESCILINWDNCFLKLKPIHRMSIFLVKYLNDNNEPLFDSVNQTSDKNIKYN